MREQGLTLIEILVALAIVAILSAIAVPSYTDYVLRGRIPLATNALADVRIRMEQFFQDNRTYPAACVTGTPTATQIQVPTPSNFTITCSGLTATTFTVIATGTGSMAGFTYTVNQQNQQSSTITKTGWTGSTTCWVIRKGGLCS